MPPCAVVVVNYGSHELLATNIVPLHRQDPSLQVIVVDNYTTDDERAAVQELAGSNSWTLVAEDVNIGFGAGVNRGVERAIADGAQHILLLNPDATIERGDLAKLRRYVCAHPETMVAPTVRTPQDTIWFAGATVRRRTGEIRSAVREENPRPEDLPWLSGACLLVDSTLWRRVGGFDDRYFLYWEDVDLSYRVLKAGGSLAVLPDVVAVHSQGGTQRARTPRAKSDTYYYHMVRNRLLFAGSHLSGRERARWQLNAPKYAWRVVLHGGRRQLLHPVSPLRAAGRGLMDGLIASWSRSRSTSSGQPMVVLQSVPKPKPTTNPYNILLVDSLARRADTEVRMFGWAEALLRHHDVFHAHWPEAMITRRGPIKTAVRRSLFGALLIKWKVSGTTIVRTVHNLEGPSDISRVERFLLDRFDRQTVGRIMLNPFTPEQGRPTRLVPHGHYRPWFDRYEVPPSTPGHIVSFGMIRRYKGMEQLVRAFHQSKRTDLSLSIAGKPSTRSLAADLESAADGDPRITLSFCFLDTAELVDHLGRAELVVLPHPEMHNSGSALAALSLDRPVLMQDNTVNRWLQEEVGPGWVHLYRGELDSEALESAVEALRNAPPADRPDLSERDWESAAAAHTELYRDALSASRVGTKRTARYAR